MNTEDIKLKIIYIIDFYLLLSPEDGDTTFLRNVGRHQLDYWTS
jgi:hypothetical protein